MNSIAAAKKKEKVPVPWYVYMKVVCMSTLKEKSGEFSCRSPFVKATEYCWYGKINPENNQFLSCYSQQLTQPGSYRATLWGHVPEPPSCPYLLQED